MGDRRLILRGGDGVMPDRVVINATLVIEEGRIAEILHATPPLDGETVRWVDGLVVPGFVDLHSDALEREIRPRPTAVLPADLALAEFDRKLAAHGITTMLHAVAFAEEEGARFHEEAERLTEVIHAHPERLLVRHRVHARYELTDLEAASTIGRCLGRGWLDLVSFMDHTPGERQFQSRAAFVAYFTRAYGLPEDRVEAVACRKLDRKRDQAALLDSTARALAAAARDQNVLLASHDDDGPEQVTWAASLGVTIAEFPVTLEAAKAARGHGLHVVMGAPNVVRGGSTSQNLAAATACAAGYLDVLCSDYYPASLLHAMVKQHRDHGAALHDAVRLITLNPARALAIDTTVGSIEPGKQADVTVVGWAGAMPVITRTIRDGREIFVAGYADQ